MINLHFEDLIQEEMSLRRKFLYLHFIGNGSGIQTECCKKKK